LGCSACAAAKHPKNNSSKQTGSQADISVNLFMVIARKLLLGWRR
jgi:hypothetical protein